MHFIAFSGQMHTDREEGASSALLYKRASRCHHVSSLSRLNKTILAHYSRFNKIATLGYIMAHEGTGTDHYSMSRLICVDRIVLLDIVTLVRHLRTHFATPTQVVTSCFLLQNDLNKIAEWEFMWQMQFNIDKCFILRVGRPKHKLVHLYTLHNQNLSETDSAKYLGLTITSDLQ